MHLDLIVAAVGTMTFRVVILDFIISQYSVDAGHELASFGPGRLNLLVHGQFTCSHVATNAPSISNSTRARVACGTTVEACLNVDSSMVAMKCVNSVIASRSRSVSRAFT